MLVPLTAFAFAAGTLATKGIFHHPIAKPAFEVELLSGLPYNITVPGGDNVAIVPNRGGEVSGAFNGEIIGNLTGARETLLPSEDGEYTVRDRQTILRVPVLISLAIAMGGRPRLRQCQP